MGELPATQLPYPKNCYNRVRNGDPNPKSATSYGHIRPKEQRGHGNPMPPVRFLGCGFRCKCHSLLTCRGFPDEATNPDLDSASWRTRKFHQRLTRLQRDHAGRAENIQLNVDRPRCCHSGACRFRHHRRSGDAHGLVRPPVILPAVHVG